MKSLHALVAASLLGLTACSQSTPPAAQQGPPFQTVASLKELMDAEIDPAADTLWDSVGFVATMSGTEERRPKTDEEWLKLRRQALTLIEGTNLLLLEGRRAAPPGTAPGAGELSPAEIEKSIATNRASFNGFALRLRQTALKVLGAIDAKDPQTLLETGGTLDEDCEACHVTFWYPHQKIPGP